MKINNNWKVESDELQYVLYKRVVRTNKEDGSKYDVWVAKSYHNTMDNLYKKLIESEIKGSGVKDIKTILDTINKLRKDLVG